MTNGRTLTWALAALAAMLLSGCPGPGARPGPGGPGAGPTEAPTPATGTDPSLEVERVASAVPEAGRVLAVVVGNTAFLAIGTDSLGAGGAPPPAAGFNADEGAAIPEERIGPTGGGEGPGGNPAHPDPEAGDTPGGMGLEAPVVPTVDVEPQVAAAIGRQLPYIQEVRFTRTQEHARQLAETVEQVRQGVPVHQFLPRLAELAGAMEPLPARVPEPVP